jgi:hypothetical protein
MVVTVVRFLSLMFSSPLMLALGVYCLSHRAGFRMSVFAWAQTATAINMTPSRADMKDLKLSLTLS